MCLNILSQGWLLLLSWLILCCDVNPSESLLFLFPIRSSPASSAFEMFEVNDLLFQNINLTKYAKILKKIKSRNYSALPYNMMNHKWYQHLLGQYKVTLHNVYFVKYDVTVSFMAQRPGIRYSGIFCVPCISSGYSDIFWHILAVDTVTYFGGNQGSRVWKSLKLKKVHFPRTRTSWDKYMFNRIVFFKF